MSIFKRISDIISANMSELAEQFENPQIMLKQAIREMEASIGEATRQTAKAMANEKTLLQELQRNRKQAEQWHARAVKAVESGDDDQARRALARKKEHEKLVAALEDQLDAAREANSGLKRQLEAMKAKLAEAKRNLATLSARQRAAEFRKKMETASIGIGTEEDDAFAKFERLKSKVEQAEAEAEAMAELRGTSPEPPPEKETAGEVDFDVEAELAELKQKAKK